MYPLSFSETLITFREVMLYKEFQSGKCEQQNLGRGFGHWHVYISPHPTVGVANLHSKSVILFLFVLFVVASIVLVRFVFRAGFVKQGFVSWHDFVIIWLGKRELVKLLAFKYVSLLACVHMSLPHSEMGWFALCNNGISWLFLLAISIWDLSLYRGFRQSEIQTSQFSYSD